MSDEPVAKTHMAMASLKQACVMMQTFDPLTCYPALRRILATAEKQVQGAIVALDLEASDAIDDTR